jgi:predicted enzyme related to lactoylglutathione lyase
MADMPRVVHFELAADDPERAANFYRTVFGWQIEKWAGPMEYWLIMTGPEGEPGIDGGLGKRGDPGEHTTNTIDVDSVSEYVEKIVANGGTVVLPQHAVPGVGYLAYCADTEGNIFGIMESDLEAH